MDMITRLTEGNQPCSRCILSSSVYPQDLWSPLMPSMLLLPRVNPLSFFQLTGQLCASLHMLLCWKNLNLAAWMQAGCASVSMSVWVIYCSSCCSSAPKTAPQSPALTADARGQTRGTENPGSSLKPSPFVLQSVFPCKIWHLTLSKIQCGPAHINYC